MLIFLVIVICSYLYSVCLVSRVLKSTYLKKRLSMVASKYSICDMENNNYELNYVQCSNIDFSFLSLVHLFFLNTSFLVRILWYSCALSFFPLLFSRFRYSLSVLSVLFYASSWSCFYSFFVFCQLSSFLHTTPVPFHSLLLIFVVLIFFCFLHYSCIF